MFFTPQPFTILSLVLQFASLAILIITSRVPVAEAEGIAQHIVSGLEQTECEAIIRWQAPELKEAELRKVAVVCAGVPLITLLVGDSLAHGRLTVEVSQRPQTTMLTTSTISHFILHPLFTFLGCRGGICNP